MTPQILLTHMIKILVDFITFLNKVSHPSKMFILQPEKIINIFSSYTPQNISLQRPQNHLLSLHSGKKVYHLKLLFFKIFWISMSFFVIIHYVVEEVV